MQDDLRDRPTRPLAGTIDDPLAVDAGEEDLLDDDPLGAEGAGGDAATFGRARLAEDRAETDVADDSEGGVRATAAGLGALGGAGVGAVVGGPIGAAVGAVAGAAAGAIGGQAAEGDEDVIGDDERLDDRTVTGRALDREITEDPGLDVAPEDRPADEEPLV